MAGQIVKGRRVRVEVGFAYAAAVPVQSVSLASPAAVGATGHGLLEGGVGYFSDVEGMDEINLQAVRAGGTVSADAFDAVGLDTTGSAEFTSGELIAVTDWRTLAQSTEYELGGGAGTTDEVTTLLDRRQKIDQMMLAAETVSISVRALTQDNDALSRIRAAARQLGGLVFRITHLSDGAQRIFYGEPSVPGESVSVGGVGSGTLSVTVKGEILYLDPVEA